MKTLATLILFFVLVNIYAQDSCRGRGIPALFQANRIGALYFPQGEKFFDQEHEFFKVPYTSQKSPSTIFACAPWIGGYVHGDLRVACQTYLGLYGQDFNTGPLNPNAEIPMELCGHFDRVWQVSRGDVTAHIEDYLADQVIDDTLSTIFGWPAQGNKYFSRFNGFDLPVNHQGGWADFADLNQNGNYDPDLGEYPIIKLKGNPYIPEEIMWMVFNDEGAHDQTKSDPLGIEIQLTVFGFNCNNNYVLNNAVFNSYKIINQNDTDIDSLFFGLFTDYDLGCASDDYMGCDSVRNTEFVYNQKDFDGYGSGSCASGQSVYGSFPPVQSMTYLSQPMHSFIFEPTSAVPSPLGYYRFLTGFFEDGTPITSFGNGYNPGSAYPVTKYLYPGDPRDSLQWSLITNPPLYGIDALTVSSVSLGKLASYESALVETVYIFHQDSTLNNLEQIGFMNKNIDYLNNHIDSILNICAQGPVCKGDECVWPGDFNHNGIADQFDLLYWGAMKDAKGSRRDGKINWEGHSADPWTLELPDLLNAKHGDGNGDGIVNDEDIERNIHHFLFTNYRYHPENHYPIGPEIILSGAEITNVGLVRGLRINAGIDIDHVLGLAYDLEFDTSIFELHGMINNWPVDSNNLIYSNMNYFEKNQVANTDIRYSCVKTDHVEIKIPKGFLIQRDFAWMLVLKPGLTYQDIPDSVVIRLRNLIAIDANGNDLHIGSNTLVVYKQEITGISNPEKNDISIYPNPTKNLLYVEVPYEVSGEIMNVQGQVIKEVLLGSKAPIDVSDLIPGIYLLRIDGNFHIYKIVIY